jgi:hypothetical protein
MRRSILLSCLLSLPAVLVSSNFARAATIVAHWSFDANTLSHDGSGNITAAAEQTGNHNASLGAGVGSATVAQGGPTFNANTIPASNSVAGQFGEALTLSGSNTAAGGGGQFLMFPNLTELMTAAGAPSYTVSYWLQTTTTNQQQFMIMSDWGNAATNPGRFTYGYGINFASGVAQMRGQSRNNTTGSGNGQDIFARVANAAALNNGSWHMLTWTFDTTTGQLKSYFDSALIDTFQSTASNGFKMVNSSSSVGTFGLKGDSGNFINGSYNLDDVWVFNGAIGSEEVQQLYQLNAIPEPASLLLLGLAVISGVATNRHRRHRTI